MDKYQIEMVLYLLREGIGIPNSDCDDSLFGSVDWKEVHHEAGMQALTGILFEGMSKTVEAGLCSIDKPLMLGWFGEVMMIERMNLRLNKVLAELVGLLRQAEIPFVVMKGQVAASLYPNPLRRQPGDIDILVGDGYFDAACQLLEMEGATAGEVAPEKHTEYRFHEAVVEMHHTMLDLSNPSAMDYIASLDLRELTEVTKVADYSVPGFKPAFNCAYMLGHMVHHLLTEGLGLRQVCDWMLLMRAIEAGRYGDTETLKAEIRQHVGGLGLENAYEAFLMLGIRDFGLSEEVWKTDCGKRAERNAADLLDFILSSGNFGKKENQKKSSHSLSGNISNAWLYLKHVAKMRNIAPNEVRHFFKTRTKRWIKKKRNH